jgi:hypothetical protein
MGIDLPRVTAGEAEPRLTDIREPPLRLRRFGAGELVEE